MAHPRLRVLTLNVYGPDNPGWEQRLPLLRHAVRTAGADVVALQEVPPDGDVVPTIVGDGFSVAPFARRSDDGVSAVLATRAPHRRLFELDQRLGGPGQIPWLATLAVEVETPLGGVVVVHHKPSWPFPAEGERVLQAETAARAVEAAVAARDVHVVVLGDFDATSDADSMRLWAGRLHRPGLRIAYQDAWEAAHPGAAGWTFDAANPLVKGGQMPTGPSRRIDHVLVRAVDHGPTLAVLSCERLLDGPVDGVWASDHAGVVADLALPAHPLGKWAPGGVSGS